jgi:hypothetical protein
VTGANYSKKKERELPLELNDFSSATTSRQLRIWAKPTPLEKQQLSPLQSSTLEQPQLMV